MLIRIRQCRGICEHHATPGLLCDVALVLAEGIFVISEVSCLLLLASQGLLMDLIHTYFSANVGFNFKVVSWNLDRQREYLTCHSDPYYTLHSK